MFVNQSAQLLDNPVCLRGGIAVSDIDGDGNLELFVTGVGSANQVLKWNGTGFVDMVDGQLADPSGQAIGVAAADLDGDGREEIYVLNTNPESGVLQYDALWDWQDDRWVDLFSLPQNRGLHSPSMGQAIATIDRWGKGQYGFLVASDEKPLKLYELRSDGCLVDVASEGELALGLGGRGVVTLPLVSNHMDIFMVSDKGPNALFRNQGNGTFEEIALKAGVSDPHGRGRGVAALDADRNGRFDLIYGNWEGSHRLFLQISPG
ncbi:MAG: VCBS repeat-containing protein, partial [Leptolyngbyaceae cyanobacterium bins.59]|nr:VCBS repeat-containing protein [Leptolyngbyaceae cyanobacterium bins.59]